MAANGDWYFARQNNNTPNLNPGFWFEQDFSNIAPYQNRWGPFLTQNIDVDPPQAAKVVYFATPGARNPATRLKAFGVLESGLSGETAIPGGANANGWGHWVRIDEKDFIISTLVDGQTGDVDVVLYDVADPNLTPINLTSDRPGVRGDTSIEWDGSAPGGGRYTLVSVRADAITGKSFVEVYQRTSPTSWVFQYEFDAHTADDSVPSNFHVQSPELFTYLDHLYIAFVTSNTPDFISATRGDIIITRIEAEDSNPADNHYRRLNIADGAVPTRKRTEPEIHYMDTTQPVVFYSQLSDPQGTDPHCNPPDYPVPVNKLMRARTGSLWQD